MSLLNPDNIFREVEIISAGDDLNKGLYIDQAEVAFGVKSQCRYEMDKLLIN